MGIGNIGIPSLILILVIALIIFGPKKLPEIGSAFGKTLKEFKNSTTGLFEDKPASDKSKNIDTANKEDKEIEEIKDIKDIKEDNEIPEAAIIKEVKDDNETKEI